MSCLVALMKKLITIIILFIPSFLIAGETREECAAKSGMEWSSKYNRCINTQEAVDMRKDHKKCAALKDKKAMDKCLDESAQESLNLAEVSTGKAGGWEGWSIVALNAVLAGVVGVTQGLDGLGEFFLGGCLHRTLFAATSLAHLASEVIFTFFAENELDKYREEFKKKDKDGNNYDIQDKSYEYFEKEQSMIKELAEQRALYYLVIAAGYGATVVTAIVEMISQNHACGLGGEAADPGEGLKKGTPAPYLYNKIDKGDPGKIWEYFSLVETAHALDGNFVKSPLVIMTLAGVGAGVCGALSWHAHQESLKAQKNIEEIQKIRKAFAEQARKHCFAGRDHMAGNDPNCFCYTESGRKNPARSKSDTCKALWEKDDKKFYVPPTDYSVASTKNKKPCVGGSGKIDKQCNCRSKTGKGQACLQAPTQAHFLGNMAEAISYPTVFADINKTLNGNLDTAKTNGAVMKKSAARSKKIAGSLLKKLNKKRQQQGWRPVSFDNKIKSAFIKNHTGKNALAKAYKSSLGGLVSSNRPSKGKGAAGFKKALKQVFYQGKKGKSGRRGKRKDPLAFNESAQDAKKSWNPTGGDDQKKYNFGDGEINKEETVPIWRIISKRYNSSAYPRLFE